MRDRICNAVAWLVVAPVWWVDRRMCRWAVVTHQPLEKERP